MQFIYLVVYNFIINKFIFVVEVEVVVIIFEISDQNEPSSIQPEHYPGASETRRLPYERPRVSYYTGKRRLRTVPFFSQAGFRVRRLPWALIEDGTDGSEFQWTQ